MVSIPHTNSEDNVVKRAALFQLITDLNDRMDFIYEFVHRYDKEKFVPTEEEVWPTQKNADALPKDTDGLKRVKKNLQSSNTKDRNLLLFQTTKKQKKENPMPKGPRRKDIEYVIKQRIKTIDIIDNKLVKLKHANQYQENN